MKLRKIKNRKAAFELSIGTVVIIVLAMAMLILGLVLVRTIFSGAQTSITQIDQGVKNEINKLFSEDNERTLVVYPDSGIVKVERGSRDAGFAISIQNIDDSSDHRFAYEVTEGAETCGGTHPVRSGEVTILGDYENDILIGAKRTLSNPRHIRLSVSEGAPLCSFSLKIEVTSSTCPACTDTAFMDVEITS